MNYNDKDKNDKIELDELNIKSHLNTSLDLSGISVSEDLINRTLAAIKEQSLSGKDEETKTSIMEPTKKIIAWNRYIRGFAGVAAAVVIVVVGYSLVQRIPFGMKKAADSALPELKVAMDSSAEVPSAGSTGEENKSFDAYAVAEKADDVQYTITAETGALENENTNADNSGNLPNSTGSEEEAPAAANENLESDNRSMAQTQEFAAAAASTADMVTYTFRQIFLPTPEQVEYITISDNQSDASITLTQQEDIEAFYIIMDSYQYSSTGNESMNESNYSVEMNSPELGTLYTLLVGRNLTVRYTQGENTVENIYYVVDDAEFKQGFEEFFAERSE